MEQPIVFYKGTESSEILKVIRKSFKLPNDLDLDFEDENGHPLVLSGFIPDGTKIHMKRSDIQSSIMSSTHTVANDPPKNTCTVLPTFSSLPFKFNFANATLFCRSQIHMYSEYYESFAWRKAEAHINKGYESMG